MANVPSRVIELVETFDRNLEAYKNQQYNETQLRREFIDPFFEELGWDITNKGGLAQAYKDVIHEDAIKIGGYTKAPDYCFRIGGTRKFFLEAKKPSIDIKADPHPAYQLRRYAWSAKLPLSILTDFEEFAVYDCQIVPKQTDRASTARIQYFNYKDYIKKWDEIAKVFSKDAILKGSFDKFAAETKGKRGTTTVDKEFLTELEKWRRELARIIALRNRDLSIQQINFAVQRTIDRIIFLRMAEDRGIETYGQLLGLSSGTSTYPRLCSVFEQADHKYNSGLFYFQTEQGRPEGPDELTLNLVIDDNPLKYILHSLYYPQCPYEFSVLPAEILGNVYEQFLGKVIRITPGHRAIVEEKPEVKKAGGIYYTPSYIVDYIVKNTVGKLLGAFPNTLSEVEGSDYDRHCEERSDEAISNKLKTKNSKLKTPKQVENLRILDPACGSGSFLLGAYTYLLNYHRDWYVENNPKKHTKQIYQGKGAQWFLTIAEKKKILLDNIFGVDIDSQAVEVTKLSLLLKVLEGENQESIENQMRLFRERALPDLGNNIKCGNSLIGPDFFDDYQRLAPAPVAGVSDEPSIPDDLYQKINPFDWKAEFPQIFSGKNLGAKQRSAEASAKADGFNAVIGNPPWGGDIDRELKYFHKTYPDCVRKTTDSFKLFVSKACRLAAQNGYVSMIVPQTLLRQNRYSDVRGLLLGFTIKSLVDLGEKVFEGVVAMASIFVVQKSVPRVNNVVEFLDLRYSQDNNEKSLLLAKPVTITNHVKQHQFLKATDFAFLPEITFGDKSWPKLGELEELRCRDAGINYQRVGVGMSVKGKSDLGERLLYEGNQEKPSHVMFWKGADIGRYRISEKTDRFCRPECKEHLRPNEVVRLALKVYEQVPKILLRQTADRILACIDYMGIWFGRSVLCITPEDKGQHRLEYFLGLLNSKYFKYLYRSIVGEKGRVFAQVKFAKLKQLPLRIIDFDNPDNKAKHDRMVKLVERMLDLHKKLAAAKVPAEKTRIQRQTNTTDNQIDNLVYKLYNLTPEEIAIVEENK